MNPAAPKRKVDVLHLVAIIAGAIAGIAGGQHLAPASAPCEVCPVCPAEVVETPVLAPAVVPLTPEASGLVP